MQSAEYRKRNDPVDGRYGDYYYYLYCDYGSDGNREVKV